MDDAAVLASLRKLGGGDAHAGFRKLCAVAEPVETEHDIINLTCRHSRCSAAEDGHAYRMVGGCYNCGTKPLIGLFTAGHTAAGGRCPACGCERLHWDRLAGPDETGKPPGAAL